MLQNLCSRFRLPSSCVVCRSWPAAAVCNACRDRFEHQERRCLRCAVSLPPATMHQPQTDLAVCGRCLVQPPPLDTCCAAVDYAYPWSDIVARFKFRDEPGLASLLADLMRQAPGAATVLARAELVLPIPLSRPRLATRGYNQALLLARKLAPERCQAQLLLRVRDTLPQAEQSLRERMGNMRNAFAVEPLQAGCIVSKHVLLIDDVMTSGATLHSAAEALRQAGAASVSALVLARTLGLGIDRNA